MDVMSFMEKDWPCFPSIAGTRLVCFGAIIIQIFQEHDDDETIPLTMLVMPPGTWYMRML